MGVISNILCCYRRTQSDAGDSMNIRQTTENNNSDQGCYNGTGVKSVAATEVKLSNHSLYPCVPGVNQSLPERQTSLPTAPAVNLGFYPAPAYSLTHEGYANQAFYDQSPYGASQNQGLDQYCGDIYDQLESLENSAEAIRIDKRTERRTFLNKVASFKDSVQKSKEAESEGSSGEVIKRLEKIEAYITARVLTNQLEQKIADLPYKKTEEHFLECGARLVELNGIANREVASGKKQRELFSSIQEFEKRLKESKENELPFTGSVEYLGSKVDDFMTCADKSMSDLESGKINAPDFVKRLVSGVETNLRYINIYLLNAANKEAALGEKMIEHENLNLRLSEFKNGANSEQTTVIKNDQTQVEINPNDNASESEVTLSTSETAAVMN